ncbi:exonuclease domain-containing protein [Arenibacter sp. GZD96]|uniref:exonuclease domain-containing protein n=1 Tax=Aurantibrevibacter litoralis TaxID=3106030 RepID=UPI002AFF4EAC|nr:exonuclease domain-containing protein [Arenibacter sp. GZD-96]MEA1785724.1 exonuclease domain-containing protein [Arenibacter sp. GZD-96]
MYSIVDIETTGNGYTGMKLTEIAIFKFDGERVIDEYTTLINPECNIPQFISNLTGITNAMVQHAPKFYEVAKTILEFTKDTVFVAHNVNFDYNGIQKEFKELGFDFKLKKLCTVRLSRKLIPHLSSYSLGPLCATQGIFITDRHRARGDAEATVKLFRQLLELDTDNTVFSSFLNVRSRQATLPPLLPKEVFEKLPETEGVYYFKNAQKDVIYVGKANNIKQRVLSHFYDKTKKELTMCMEVADIDFTETGSELLALLLESAEIKQLFPKYNRAQRRVKESIALFTYEDTSGVLHLAYNHSKLVQQPLLKFYSVTECRSFLETLCETYELCPKYCSLQTNVSSCFHYQIKQCKGVCRQEEAINTYNNRVLRAVASLQFENQNFVIWEKGRHPKETAFVLVQGGIYKGFGYKTAPLRNISPKQIASLLVHQKDNRDIHRILNSYLKKHPENLQLMTVAVEDDLFSLMSPL